MPFNLLKITIHKGKRALRFKRKVTLTQDEVDRKLESLRHLPLTEVERVLGVNGNNDVRFRSGYSHNKYYKTLRPADREARRRRVNGLLKKVKS